MNTRRENLLAALEARGAQAFVACQRPNQLYLLDHPDPASVISRPNCFAVVFSAAQTTVFPGIWISNACRDLLDSCRVIENQPGDLPPDQQLAAWLKAQGWAKVICDREVLGEAVAGMEIVVEDVVSPLRRIKDERDLEGLKEAARIADLGMQTAFKAIRPGITCLDVIAEGTAAMLRAGAESVSMAPASGVGTYYLDSGEDPRRVIDEGDMIFIDMGIYVRGYLGDMTRASIVGEGTPQQRDLLETVQQAYKLGSQAMVPGASATAIYQAVVDHYAAKGWDQYFVHHLSHGLGLGADLPRIARGTEDTLQEGDALSCEPGLYIPGIGGARVENMIYVSSAGPVELNRCPLEPAMGF